MSFNGISLERTPKYALFYGAHFAFLLVDIQILPIFLDLNIRALIFLAAIYYWSIYHPSLIPSWLLFLSGLVKDLLTGFPLICLSSVIFIGVHEIVKKQRIFLSGQSFFMIWAVYVLVSIFVCCFYWGILCLYVDSIQTYKPFLIEGVLMALSFPLTLSAMAGIHRILPFASHDKASL